MIRFILLFMIGGIFIPLQAQIKYTLIPFGNFEQWVVRNIKESRVIGGNKKTVYAIGPNRTINGEIAYTDTKGSPWGSSNVMAVVAGITKTSNSVFPENRENGGKAIRMETMFESCKVLGIVNITVLISGSVYLGSAQEPIKNAQDPYTKINMGIPFSEKPVALRFDYKAQLSDDSILTRAKSFSIHTYKGKDYANAFVFLQKRWEDKNGNIYAKRVGTGRELFGKSTKGWVDNYVIPIYYGNITGKPYYKSYMGLTKNFCAKNSKGKMVPIQEIGWGDNDDTPTHLVMMFSCGVQGAFEGALGNKFWIDNVALGYDK